VAANLARDESRRSSVRRQHLALVQAQPRPIEKGPEHAIEQRERARRVRAALSQLSERDRETLLLWQEGLSYEEIGRVVGLARKSIGTTLARARGRLAAAYEALGSKGSDRDVAS
jgi:RNA polymerase sigma factor (sigma-70 family)